MKETTVYQPANYTTTQVIPKRKCPKCGGENITIQAINEVKLKNSHHGIVWWLCIGCWWVPTKWLFLTVPALLAKIFIPAKQKAKNKTVTTAVCQNCGNIWKI